MIRLENVSKKFGYTVALKNVSIEIDGPGLVYIRGPNGSGKTTLLKIISGILRPSSGMISVFGYDPYRNINVLSNRMSYQYEDDPLPWWESGHNFLEFICTYKGFELGELYELIDGLGVGEYWHKRISTYSSGMRRKIQIIKAFIGSPELIILDEPLTLLDRNSKNFLTKYLEELKNDKLLLVSSHIDEGLSGIADLRIDIENGEIINVR